MDNLERLITVAGAVGALALIVTGHGPGRWFWEGVVDVAHLAEPAVHHILAPVLDK